jgi:hypothetical protein
VGTDSIAQWIRGTREAKRNEDQSEIKARRKVRKKEAGEEAGSNGKQGRDNFLATKTIFLASVHANRAASV